VYEQAAAEKGLPLSDYIGVLLAHAHDLEEPAYVHRQQRSQAELPLGACA
jgi:hypothetical protein